MAKKHPDPHQQLLALLHQVVAVASALAAPPAARPGNHTTSRTPGIYPHTSKYNPWRAYVWCPRSKSSVYLGAFPTVAKARAAQAAFRAGQPITSGTKGLRLVEAA